MNTPTPRGEVSRHCEPPKAVKQSRIYSCGAGSLCCARDDDYAASGKELNLREIKTAIVLMEHRFTARPVTARQLTHVR